MRRLLNFQCWKRLLLFAGCGALAVQLLAADVPSGGLQTQQASQAVEFPAATSAKVVSKILFGSCANQNRQIPIFETMAAQQPELLIFLGDNIYADTTDMELMRKEYAKLKARPRFQRLLQSCPVLATWDDHDYGANDAGAEFPQRVAAEKIFLDFWGEPLDSPRRQRPGVYESRIFGPPGKRVQVILLDTRYFRGPLKKGVRRVGGPYYPNTEPDITVLGDAQWQWLNVQLQQPAEIRLLASSIQCVSQASGQETWSNFPHERQRLFDLIAECEAEGVLIISGDRHWAELSLAEQTRSYPIYDLTSSSFNQIHPRGTPTENRFRAHATTYHRENFGAIHIDWEQKDPEIRLQVLDLQGKARIEKMIRLSALRDS